MTSNYKRIGNYIQLVNNRNIDLETSNLLGINIDKFFMPSVANIVGTDLRNYKLVKKDQFACNRMHVGRDLRIPIALSREEKSFIVSPAYDVFEIIDSNVLNEEYLMMWFSRREFDRNAWFYTDADVRGGLPWKSFCNIKLPIPSLEKQQEIVNDYNIIANRIKINEALIQKLEETAQALYKHWFVDFEFPDENVNPYKSSGGEMVWNEKLGKEIPEGWTNKSLGEICSKIGSGATPKGGKDSYQESGVSLIRSTNVHDYYFSTDDLAYINSQQAEKLKNVIVESKDVLLNITGVSVTRCSMVPEFVIPARVNQHVIIIRPEQSINNYLMHLLCHQEAKSKLLGISQAGSTREAITKVEIEAFQIPIPSTSLVQKFENLNTKLFGKIEMKRKENVLLRSSHEVLHSKLALIEN